MTVEQERAARARGKQMAQTYEFAFRHRYNLPPTDPRFRDATPEQMRDDYWAHRAWESGQDELLLLRGPSTGEAPAGVSGDGDVSTALQAGYGAAYPPALSFRQVGKEVRFTLPAGAIVQIAGHAHILEAAVRVRAEDTPCTVVEGVLWDTTSDEADAAWPTNGIDAEIRQAGPLSPRQRRVAFVRFDHAEFCIAFGVPMRPEDAAGPLFMQPDA